jgi:peptidyl-tRNA hydrolase
VGPTQILLKLSNLGQGGKKEDAPLDWIVKCIHSHNIECNRESMDEWIKEGKEKVMGKG